MAQQATKKSTERADTLRWYLYFFSHGTATLLVIHILRLAYLGLCTWTQLILDGVALFLFSVVFKYLAKAIKFDTGISPRLDAYGIVIVSLWLRMLLGLKAYVCLCLLPAYLLYKGYQALNYIRRLASNTVDKEKD